MTEPRCVGRHRLRAQQIATPVLDGRMVGICQYLIVLLLAGARSYSTGAPLNPYYVICGGSRVLWERSRLWDRVASYVNHLSFDAHWLFLSCNRFGELV